MTGTAMTESEEFQEIYSLDVVEIPTNKPMIRKDYDDVMYKTEKAKFNAIIEQIRKCHEKGQPVLVGTVSIEKSEQFSHALKRSGIKHEVLNAKQHEREAEIVAQAGKFGAVTIATNMAGRGTDIILGGNAEYLAKAQMRKMEYTDELISEATGFSETTDEAILEARKTFSELESKYKAFGDEQPQKGRSIELIDIFPFYFAISFKRFLVIGVAYALLPLFADILCKLQLPVPVKVRDQIIQRHRILRKVLAHDRTEHIHRDC